MSLMKQQMVKLALETVQVRLNSINGSLQPPRWTANFKGASLNLQANYKFRNFAKTWDFLNEMATTAHKMRHHPTITTTYNKVHILLTTHDAENCITELDTSLAEKIELLYEKFTK